jgi:nitrite reductase/ring-hydroxylating ferredoxin subunit
MKNTTETNDEITTSAIVANIADLTEGTMKVVRVGDRRILLVCSAKGIYALDNACPHQGYGLALGDLTNDTVTCLWHNWKFAVETGGCVVGEENVPSHQVTIEPDGGVRVTVTQPAPQELRPKLLTSLRSAVENNYVGQMARDAVRLLQNDANPGELAWTAVQWGAPRSEYGWGHAVGFTADCLTIANTYEGLDRALPIVQALSGIAYEHRAEPLMALPDPIDMRTQQAKEAFRRAVESEDLTNAQGILRGAIAANASPEELREWFVTISSDHFLSYGHGAIYVQKGFELLDHLGWARADTVLPHLIPAIVYGTREDRLPYMRPFMRELQGVSLDTFVESSQHNEPFDATTLKDAILNHSDRTAFLKIAKDALANGASVDRLLDVAVESVSERMLRFRIEDDFNLSDDFGWLDLTHGITFTNAARWQWHHHPSTASLRQALFTLWLAHWTGRHEWHTSIGDGEEVAIPASIEDAAKILKHESLLDHSGSFIVSVHGVKTAEAAFREAKRTGNNIALQAAARFLRAPKMERFVASSVAQATDFLTGKSSRE